MSLPFALLQVCVSLLIPSDAVPAAEAIGLPIFQEFASSCINLAQYDAKAEQLTVRFVNRSPARFYRYSSVPPEVWQRLIHLNNDGGVGEYLNEVIVQHPKKFPFEEIAILKFKTTPAPKTKKPKTQ